MQDWIGIKEVSSPSDRVLELIKIYRDDSLTLIGCKTYKDWFLYHYLGETAEVVIMCQVNGNHIERYDIISSEEWSEEGERWVDEIGRQIEERKANQSNRFSPINYDDIPF